MDAKLPELDYGTQIGNDKSGSVTWLATRHLKNPCCQLEKSRWKNVKLRGAHVPGMLATFSPPPTLKKTASKHSRYTSRHVRLARTVMHVGIAYPRWRGKHSRHSPRMRNPQIYVSGKRPMVPVIALGNTWLDSTKPGMCNCKGNQPITIALPSLHRITDAELWWNGMKQAVEQTTVLSVIWEVMTPMLR